MRLPACRLVRFAIIPAAIALLGAPLAAQTATPASLSFCYNPSAPAPIPPQTISVAGTSGTPVAVVSAILANGTSSLFDESESTGTIGAVNVVVKTTSSPPTTYSDTLIITTATNTINVPVTFSTLSGCVPTGGSSPGSGLISSSVNLVALQAPVGGTNAASVNLTSTANVNVTVDVQVAAGSSVGWLSATFPGGGTSAAMTASTPLQLTVNGNASGLAAGSYAGVVLVEVGGGTVLTVPVAFLVGSGATGSVSAILAPNSYSYAPGGTVPAVSSLVLAMAPNTAYTVTSNAAWLVFGNGFQTTAGTANASGAALVPLTINPTGLTASTYTGVLNVTVSGGSASQSVYLAVGSGGSTGSVTVSKSNLSFSGPNTLTSALNQTVTVTTAQSFTVFATSDRGWLTVTPSIGPSGTSVLTVYAATAGLNAGTYSGAVTVNSTGGSANIAVSLTVTGGTGTGGLIATPAALQFNSSNNQPQTIVLGGLLGQGFSVTLTANQSWLAVTPPSGIVGTNNLTVTTVPGSLGVGTYSANITITSGTASATVPVTLTVAPAGTTVAPIVAPTTLTFWYENNSGAPVWPQQILLSGAPGASYTVAAAGAAWLSTDQTSGTIPSIGFQPITVRVAGAAAPVGSSSGTLAVTVGAQTASVAVNMNVVNSPVLVPQLYGGYGDVVADYQVGGVFPFIPTMQVGSSGAALSVSASSNNNWIAVSADQNTTPANLTITIDPTKLSNGLNTGSITIAGSSSGQQVIPVVIGAAGGFRLDQASVAFSAPQGGASQSQVVHLTSISSASFSTAISTSSGANWLSVSPASGTAGTAATSLTITASPASLIPGTYQGTLTVTVGSTSQNVGVTLTVTAAQTGTITASPATLAFQYTVGGTAPAAQALSLAVSGANSVSFTAQAATTSGGNWLAVAPVSGSAPATLQVSVTPGSLAAGTYNGTVTITPAGGTALSPVNVTLTVNPAVAPGISVSPSSLQFSYDAGGAVPAAQAVHVTSAGAGIQFAAAASSSGWLLVSPASGTVPGDLSVTINPANLSAGNYSGTITVTPANSTPAQSVNVSLTVTVPLPTITSVKNAASYAANAISPGEIVAIFGTQMGPATGQGLTLDQTGKVSTTLANTQVLINGIAAPVVYTSAGQVNAVVPYQVSGRTSAVIQVTYAGSGSNSLAMPVATTVPGLFTQNASGMGPGAILNADLSLNTTGNPAAKGSTIVIYLTGEGQTNPGGINGLVTAGPTYPMPILPVTVLIDGQPTNVTFVGEAPSLVSGVLQVNATVPPAARSGDVRIFVSVGPNQSQLGVTVSVK